MTTHPMMLQVVLPETQTPVRELMHAMAKHLEADAKRYMKVHKVGKDRPAVMDKTDAAKRLRDAAAKMYADSKKRWD